MSEQPVGAVADPVTYKTALTLSMAYLIAPMVLWVPGLLAAQGRNGDAPETAPLLIAVFATVAITACAMSYVMRALIIRPVGPSAAEGAQGPERKAFSGFIIGWALCESGVLLGFVLFILTGDWRIYAAFWAVYLVGAAGAFATPGRWHAWVERATTPTGPIISQG